MCVHIYIYIYIYTNRIQDSKGSEDIQDIREESAEGFAFTRCPPCSPRRRPR